MTAGVRWGTGGEVEVGRGGRGMSARPPPLALVSVGMGGRGMSGRVDILPVGTHTRCMYIILYMYTTS